MKNYLYTDLKNHKFIPVFQETIDLYLRYKVINANDFVVYQVLMRYLCRKPDDKHYGFTYITNRGISGCSGVSCPTVAKSITKLSKAGLIQIHENPFRQGDYQKNRYTLFEPLPKEEFFEYFRLKKIHDEEVEEILYTQGNTKTEIVPKEVVDVIVEDDEEVKEEKKEKPKEKEKEKPKKETKPKKKPKDFKDKETKDWNYKDFIYYFCHKFKEAYGIEYRVSNWAKEQKRLKNTCEKYFKEDKVAFRFYIDELFIKRKRFENSTHPTLLIGTVCTFTNAIDIPKLLKKSQLLDNQNQKQNQEVKNNQTEVKIIDNNNENMVECKEKVETPNIEYMSEAAKKSSDELKSLFNL